MFKQLVFSASTSFFVFLFCWVIIINYFIATLLKKEQFINVQELFMGDILAFRTFDKHQCISKYK